jgi:hypothetical protein
MCDSTKQQLVPRTSTELSQNGHHTIGLVTIPHTTPTTYVVTVREPSTGKTTLKGSSISLYFWSANIHMNQIRFNNRCDALAALRMMDYHNESVILVPTLSSTLLTNTHSV